MISAVFKNVMADHSLPVYGNIRYLRHHRAGGKPQTDCYGLIGKGALARRNSVSGQRCTLPGQQGKGPDRKGAPFS